MDRHETARAYYRALDEADYDALADLLAPAFVHDRPDVTLEGADRFVQFMREERPRTDTTHAVDAVYGASPDRTDGTESPGSATETDGVAAGDDAEVAVRGRLLGGDELIVRFVDVFGFEGDAIGRLTTYTNGSTGE